MKTLAALLLIAPLVAPPPAQADENVKGLLNHIDDLYRGTASTATLTMHIQTAHWERTLKLDVKSQGTDKALVRILAPAKERGTVTLRVGDNLWNYLPKVDRTIKVPAAMMSNSWMGSQFTNDDLVEESRLARDYDSTLNQKPKGKTGQYVITLIPKPDAPVVWGKVVMALDAQKLPESAKYYDEKGKLIRTLTYSDVETIDNRRLPTTLTVVPAGKPGEMTSLHYDALDLNAALPSDTFSLQALRR